jgi:hypothetical protein
MEDKADARPFITEKKAAQRSPLGKNFERLESVPVCHFQFQHQKHAEQNNHDCIKEHWESTYNAF